MKKIILIISITILSNLVLNAQDLITKRNGEDIKAKVIEIGLNEVKFKRFDNLDGPLITIEKSEILIIRYENGSKEIFEESNNTTLTKAMPQNIDWHRQGEIDAQKYYRGYRKHFAGTFIPCIFLGPVIGLAPAGGNMRAKIKEDDMINERNQEWFKNTEYKDSYTKYAKKMKTKRVVGGYFGGSGIFLGIVVAIISSGIVQL